MEFKNKSSQPVQMVVRASSKIRSNNYTKNRIYKRVLNYASLPNPIDYYSENLDCFQPKKTWSLAICPFHNDRKPSLAVHIKIGAFICFACGARGKSIIGFHAKKHDLTFAQACKALGVTHG